MECLRCDKSGTGENVILCDKCDSETHFSCAGLTEEQVERIVNYFCNSCEDFDSCLTTWSRTRMVHTAAEKVDKDRNYYDVERIVGHRISKHNRYFHIEWKSASTSKERTWEVEKNLDGCIDLLQRYCKDHSLPLSEIEGFVGADTEAGSSDRRNWVTLNTIIEQFNKMKKRLQMRNNLSLEIYEDFGDKDGLYLFEFRHHCFVLLYLARGHMAFIADGSNLHRRNPDVLDALKNMLKVRLISVEYNQQVGVDHCGSSAVLIAIEFNRMFNLKTRFFKLTPGKWARTVVARQMHKHDSQKLKESSPREFAPLLKCHICQKVFLSHKRKSYNRHIRNHSQTKRP